MGSAMLQLCNPGWEEAKMKEYEYRVIFVQMFMGQSVLPTDWSGHSQHLAAPGFLSVDR
jgi:hypothetical protein